MTVLKTETVIKNARGSGTKINLIKIDWMLISLLLRTTANRVPSYSLSEVEQNC